MFKVWIEFNWYKNCTMLSFYELDEESLVSIKKNFLTSEQGRLWTITSVTGNAAKTGTNMRLEVLKLKETSDSL
jgi:hypothetical protein